VADDEAVRTVHGLPHDGDDFLVHSEVVEGGLTVHVAANLDDIDESAAALRGALLVVVPLAAAALAAVLWVLVGRLLRRAAAADARQRSFVADASHELRNPLTRIRTELEVDLAHPDRARPMATHRVVLDEAIGMQRLVDDLLQLARLDEGSSRRPASTVDLDGIVDRIAVDLRAAGQVDVDTAGVGAAQVRGDPDQLRRLVANLADNAARHAATTVRFEVSSADGRAVVAIADDGAGIPPAERERVFERFARVDSARSATAGGTGLGLAIAREIALAHGGRIEVDPAHSPGARLVVTLPLSGRAGGG
jgi:signal transduction histidine kinase